MKRNLTAAVALLTFTTSFGQISKDSWLIGGNFTFASEKSQGNNVVSYTSTVFQISINGGYFFFDKLAGGIKTGFQHSKIKVGGPNEGTTLEIGPFVRYYFLHPEKQINIFAEAAYEHIAFLYPNSENTRQNRFSFLAGPVVFVNPAIGLEFTIGYSSSTFENYDQTVNNLHLGFGLQVHLPQKSNKPVR
jgi:hypothetical protein